MAGVDQMEITARAVTNKKPVPEIDFTLHTMEDGSQVSTQDRVCKGGSLPAGGSHEKHHPLILTYRCPSASVQTSYR